MNNKQKLLDRINSLEQELAKTRQELEASKPYLTIPGIYLAHYNIAREGRQKRVIFVTNNSAIALDEWSGNLAFGDCDVDLSLYTPIKRLSTTPSSEDIKKFVADMFKENGL